MKEKMYKLKGGEYIITENANDVWRVTSGTLLVFIVPYKNNNPGRRSFLYEANEKELIPSYCYRDMNYQEWRFLFTPLDEVVLEKMPDVSTKILRERFSKKASIKMYDKEGYEEGLRYHYEKNLVKEDSFIIRTQKQREDISLGVLDMILKSFSKKNSFIDIPTDANNVYKSLFVLSQYQKINLIEYDVVREVYGKNATLDEIARLSHFTYRKILLEHEWFNSDCGPILVQWEKDFYPVIRKNNKYYLQDYKNDKELVVNKKLNQNLEAHGYMVYRSLPLTEIEQNDIVKFIWQSISKKDLILLFLLTVVISFISLLTPSISQHIYDEYIPLGANNVLLQLGCLLGMFMLCNIMISIVERLVKYKIVSRVSYDVQSAIYDRVFKLPESFFRNYDSADLTQRISGIGSVYASITAVFITSIAILIMVFIDFARLATYSVYLAFIGLIMILFYASVCIGIKLYALKYKEESLKLQANASSKMYQYIMGINKIRIAGVENRAIFEYMKPYIKYRNAKTKQTAALDCVQALETICNSVFLVALYILVIKNNNGLTLGGFIAFTSVFGAFTSYLMNLINGFMELKQLKPELSRIKPIFTVKAEFEDGKEVLKEINGKIEINNLSFSYDESGIVLDCINLKINAGEYVGIVGSSGSGKSTLLKLLLGFEKPTSGKIYYDDRDLDGLDKSALRKHLGVVLQNGSLISGSIYENITITNPKATLNDVKEVVKKAGLEEDIGQMPMGLHTVLSEGCNTISGGQMQRILIARALISNPKVLYFDEATSALDNITQKTVSQTLDKMSTTRILIAHRLSTIINCDRILVMEKGKVVEQGTYDYLMNLKGVFYQLASRQLLDKKM